MKLSVVSLCLIAILSGKSTIIKLLMRGNTDGRRCLYKWSGFIFTRKKDLPYLRRGIGIVFQDFKLLNQKLFLKCRFAMEILGASYREIKDKFLWCWSYDWERSEIVFPINLWREQQRVSLARAIVNVFYFNRRRTYII